ncbi:hypothetical protein MH928_13745 [Flavobacterium sp. WW92]|uniref:hypothetical protein n=1 Tax=unclassified Flavobacterium TaxID=196869 RepID=UPI002224F3CA|nr:MULTISPECIES: hypothetical protein [unclassified Flavobacterium]WDO12382.1 hypothetical protein MH928_13745 [Flavobacterium sp. WW92]
MIEKFCSRLPREISNPMYNEYYNRLREINFILENRDTYKSLIPYRKTIELILSLAIFYKRVIANMDAATKFAGTVFTNSTATAIRIGTYDLTGTEKNRITAIVMNYNSMIEKYSLTQDILTTVETKDLIRKIKNLKWQLDNNENLDLGSNTNDEENNNNLE